jgi:hypothetical protein
VARLDDVVGAILRDLTLAQDVASKHSRMLAVEYAGDPLLRHFPVPRTQLSDVEIELRFAPRQLTRVSGSDEGTLAAAKQAFDAYAPLAATALLGVASDRFTRAKSMPGFPSSMLAEISQGLESSDFKDYVTKSIAADLYAARTKIVTPPDKLDLDAARETTIATAVRVVFEHPDLHGFLDANPSFAKDSLAAVNDALKDPLNRLSESFSSADLHATQYELDVALDPTELQDTGAATYSTIRIKADMKNYRWVSSPGTADQLVEEG